MGAIATRASTVKGQAVPFQIHAEFLRERQASAPSDAMAAFGMPPAAVGPDSSKKEAHRKAHWRQSDVKRAISAAESAGLVSYRIEIAPDGAISIVVGPAVEQAASADSCTDLPGS